MKKVKIAGVLICGQIVAACSGPYTPIVDGAVGPRYQQDLAECRQVSMQKQPTNAGATGGAIVGGLIGGAEADDDDTLEGVVAGAIVGGLIGSAEEKAEVEKAKDKIVFHCMRGRGHNVVG